MKKATFNKANEAYPHGSLREQPEMEKPVASNYFKYREVVFETAQQAYKDHIDSLCTIICDENNWVDGVELVEGKDYRLSYTTKNGDLVPLAVPIVQETESENDLWEEVADLIYKHKWRTEVKSKFTIQRRKQ